jgi:kynurenine formamidase
MNVPKKLYDLSHPLYHNCPGWPDFDVPVLNVDYNCALDGFNAETMTMNMHTGTHVDAPFHFIQEGRPLDQMPIDAFAGPSVVFDLREKVKPDSPITDEMLKPFMDQVQKGDIVLLCTGYGQKRGINKAYLHEYPYLGGPGAELLAAAGVKGVGTDTLSIGGYGSAEKACPAHLALLSKDLLIVEELCFPPEVLDGKRRYFTAFALKMKGCGGAPARAVLFEF